MQHNVLDILRAKRDGVPVDPDALRWLVEAYTAGELPDYQMAAFLMAVFFRGMRGEELAAWTQAMLHSGRVLDWSALDGVPVDKHSTGGVGDKISLPLAPAVAACGAAVPMVSGRALGHTGGTLDKLESIPGFRVDLPLERARALVEELGLVLIGQTAEVAPADRKIYALRDTTCTVESIPLIASSIMSKKLAEGIRGLVLDVKTGSGAFMRRLEDARALAEALVEIGARNGCASVAWITRMDRPLGRAVGNAVEVAESVEVLRGGGPPDVRELVEVLGGEMLVLAGVAPDMSRARAAVARALDDGTALERFRALVEAQGGDPRAVDDPEAFLPQPPHRTVWTAPRAGWIRAIDTQLVGIACMRLGAGRTRVDDVIDPSVGFRVLRTVGDRVERGEPIVEVLYADEARRAEAVELLARAYDIGEEAVPPGPPLLIERLERRPSRDGATE